MGHVDTRERSAALLRGRWEQGQRWDGIARSYAAADVVRPARLDPRRAHPRHARRREALAAADAGRRPCRSVGGADGRAGDADGEGRPARDLPLRLAGRRRREPRREHVPGSEPLSGEQRAGSRAPNQQCVAQGRPDPVRRGRGGRHRLSRPDRRRRRSRLRRRAERVRVDAGDDRGRRGRRALRGPALVREEVRPPGRQGARADDRSSSARSSPRGSPPTCSTCRPSCSPAPTRSRRRCSPPTSTRPTTRS